MVCSSLWCEGDQIALATGVDSSYRHHVEGSAISAWSFHWGIICSNPEYLLKQVYQVIVLANSIIRFEDSSQWECETFLWQQAVVNQFSLKLHPESAMSWTSWSAAKGLNSNRPLRYKFHKSCKATSVRGSDSICIAWHRFCNMVSTQVHFLDRHCLLWLLLASCHRALQLIITFFSNIHVCLVALTTELVSVSLSLVSFSGGGFESKALIGRGLVGPLLGGVFSSLEFGA